MSGGGPGEEHAMGRCGYCAECRAKDAAHEEKRLRDTAPPRDTFAPAPASTPEPTSEYALEALWTLLREAVADQSAKAIAVRGFEEELHRARLVLATSVDVTKARQRDLNAILDGKATIAWNDKAHAFVVEHADGEQVGLPRPRGEHDARLHPPRNAAHVGSSNQGQVGT